MQHIAWMEYSLVTIFVWAKLLKANNLTTNIWNIEDTAHQPICVEEACQKCCSNKRMCNSHGIPVYICVCVYTL